MAALEITNQTLTRGRQDFRVTRLGTAERRAHLEREGRKFRTTIVRDSYDFQGFAKVELWTPNGWTEVVTLAGTHPVMKELPSYVTRDDAECVDAATPIARMLETQAEEITR